MADSAVGIAFQGKDEVTPVVRGIRTTIDRFKADARTGFGLGAGISIFNIAKDAFFGAVDVMHGAANAARDMTETQSKLDAVFGSSADTVRQWADGSAERIGLSEQKALEATATFGNFLQSMGAGREDAVSMSQGLVDLSADLASLNNLAGGADEAQQALFSGMSGQMEAVRRLGIDISETAVEQFLLGQGIEKVNGQFTQAQKVAARYALIMEDTKTAQGNFALTADDTANAQRTLDAKLQDAQAQYGGLADEAVNAGTQIATQLVEALEGVAVALNDLRRFLDPTSAKLEDMDATLAALAPEYGLTADEVREFRDAQAASAATAASAAQDEALLQSALDNYRQSLAGAGMTTEEVDAAVADYKKTLQASTGSTRRATGATLAHEDETRALIEAYIAQAGKTGAVTAKTDDLTSAIHRVPDEVSIHFATPGAQAALDLINHINAVAGDVVANITPVGAQRLVAKKKKRAHGGPVSAGDSYLVGESGPELLTMGSRSGHITSNRDMRGGHGHAIVMDGRVVGRAVDERLGDRYALTRAGSHYRSGD